MQFRVKGREDSTLWSRGIGRTVAIAWETALAVAVVSWELEFEVATAVDVTVVPAEPMSALVSALPLQHAACQEHKVL